MEMIVRDSTINGDVIATDSSRITLIDSVIAVQEIPGEEGATQFGNIVATGNGIITLINTRVEGKIIVEDLGRIIIE